MNKENKNIENIKKVEQTPITVDFTVRGLSDLYGPGEISYNFDFRGDTELYAYHVMTGQLTENPLSGWSEQDDDGNRCWSIIASEGDENEYILEFVGDYSDKEDEGKKEILYTISLTIETIKDDSDNKEVQFKMYYNDRGYDCSYRCDEYEEIWDFDEEIEFYDFDYVKHYVENSENSDIGKKITILQLEVSIDYVELGFTDEDEYYQWEEQEEERFDNLDTQLRDELGNNLQFIELVEEITNEKINSEKIEFSEKTSLSALKVIRDLYQDTERDNPIDCIDTLSPTSLSEINEEITEFLQTFRKYGGYSMNIDNFSHWVYEKNPFEKLQKYVNMIVTNDSVCRDNMGGVEI